MHWVLDGFAARVCGRSDLRRDARPPTVFTINDAVRFAFDGTRNHEAGFEVNATRGIPFGTIVRMQFAGYDEHGNPVFRFSHQIFDPFMPITPHDHRDNSPGGGIAVAVCPPTRAYPSSLGPWDQLPNRVRTRIPSSCSATR